MEQKIITETVKKTIYIASDGREFPTAASCAIHEHSIRSDLLKRSGIETCKKANFYACFDGDEHLANNTYRWYRPQNADELALLRGAYPDIAERLDKSLIGKWLCVEQNCYGEVWLSTLDDGFAYVKNLMNRLGYDCEISFTPKAASSSNS